jgi:hypothetical protein
MGLISLSFISEMMTDIILISLILSILVSIGMWFLLRCFRNDTKGKEHDVINKSRSVSISSTSLKSVISEDNFSENSNTYQLPLDVIINPPQVNFKFSAEAQAYKKSISNSSKESLEISIPVTLAKLSISEIKALK